MITLTYLKQTLQASTKESRRTLISLAKIFNLRLITILYQIFVRSCSEIAIVFSSSDITKLFKSQMIIDRLCQPHINNCKGNRVGLYLTLNTTDLCIYIRIRRLVKIPILKKEKIEIILKQNNKRKSFGSFTCLSFTSQKMNLKNNFFSLVQFLIHTNLTYFISLRYSIVKFLLVNTFVFV